MAKACISKRWLLNMHFLPLRKKRRMVAFNERVWVLVNQNLALIFGLLTLLTVILSCVFVARQDTVFRICFEATAGAIVGSTPGETGAVVTGMMTMDATYNTIKYELRTITAMTGITAIHIRGPTTLSTPQVGPVYIAICGGITGAAVCDTTTVAGQVTGTVTTIYDGELPEATDVRPAVEQLRRQPYLYYIEILTNDKPTTPGSCRANIVAACGFE